MRELWSTYCRSAARAELHDAALHLAGSEMLVNRYDAVSGRGFSYITAERQINQLEGSF